jgi:DNA-binding LacI/PurR family transcriptional regulator
MGHRPATFCKRLAGVMAAITLSQIAKLAGVSLATASRVVNDQPGVRPEVRARVWQIVREHGYQPNLAAQVLAAQRAAQTRSK